MSKDFDDGKILKMSAPEPWPDPPERQTIERQPDEFYLEVTHQSGKTRGLSFPVSSCLPFGKSGVGIDTQTGVTTIWWGGMIRTTCEFTPDAIVSVTVQPLLSEGKGDQPR